MPVLTKKTFTYSRYWLDGEQVSLSFVWQITAKVTRIKSKITRVEHFEVIADSRHNAHERAEKQFKGAYIKEVISCIPVAIWKHSFYLDRKHPDSAIPSEILSEIQIPDDL